MTISTKNPLLIKLTYEAFAVLSTSYVFRHFVKSHGAIISGDRGDTRIMIALLEHWKGFFSGIETWSSPLFFYPTPNVLGNTDAHALYAPIYSFLRIFSDQYISYEMTLAFTRLLGFFFMALLLRSSLRLSHWTCILGATLFTIMASSYVHLGHGQFVVIAYIPLLMYLVLRFLRSPPNATSSWMCGLGAAFLFSALCLSTFYVAWFAVLAGVILSGLLFVWAMLRFGWSRTLHVVLSWARLRVRLICAIIAVAVGGAIPFGYLYLPKLREHGGYSLDEIMQLAQRPADIFNAGAENWLWGGLLSNAVFNSMTPNFGLAPILLIFVFFGIISSGYKLHSSRGLQIEAGFAFFVAVSGVLLWLLLLRFDGWTPYWLIYHYFPGGSAMRAPYRVTMLEGALLIPAAMIGLSQLVRWIDQANSNAAAVCAAILCLLLISEERMLYTPGDLFRVSDLRLLNKITSVPVGCQSFFVYGFVANGDRPLIEYFYGPTTLAMMIAERDHIPTLNGMSTVSPKGWNLMPPLGDPYLLAVQSWRDLHGLKSVCELNLFDLTWNARPFKNE